MQIFFACIVTQTLLGITPGLIFVDSSNPRSTERGDVSEIGRGWADVEELRYVLPESLTFPS